MVEAVRTYASPAAIWVIVVVAVLLLAFWLTAIFLADRSQVLTSGQSRPGTKAKPAVGTAWTGGSLPGEQAPEVPGEAVHEPIGARGRHAGEEPVPEGDIPTRADVPAQSGGSRDVPSRPVVPGQPAQAGQPRGEHPLPAQRTGEADRAERSYAGPLPPDEGETGRQVPSRWRWILTRGHR